MALRKSYVFVLGFQHICTFWIFSAQKPQTASYVYLSVSNGSKFRVLRSMFCFLLLSIYELSANIQIRSGEAYGSPSYFRLWFAAYLLFRHLRVKISKSQKQSTRIHICSSVSEVSKATWSVTCFLALPQRIYEPSEYIQEHGHTADSWRFSFCLCFALYIFSQKICSSESQITTEMLDVFFPGLKELKHKEYCLMFLFYAFEYIWAFLMYWKSIGRVWWLASLLSSSTSRHMSPLLISSTWEFKIYANPFMLFVWLRASNEQFEGRLLSLPAILTASDPGHTCSLLISPTQLNIRDLKCMPAFSWLLPRLYRTPKTRC